MKICFVKAYNNKCLQYSLTISEYSYVQLNVNFHFNSFDVTLFHGSALEKRENSDSLL